jgi:hypothetical protein
MTCNYNPDRRVTYIVTTMRTNGKLITHILGNPLGITCTALGAARPARRSQLGNRRSLPPLSPLSDPIGNQTDIILM